MSDEIQKPDNVQAADNGSFFIKAGTKAVGISAGVAGVSAAALWFPVVLLAFGALLVLAAIAWWIIKKA